MRNTVIGVLLFAGLMSCDNSEDESKRSTESKVAEVETTAGNGQWRITNFSDNNTNQTNTFTGYIFEFDADNTLTATNGSANYPGSWTVTDDDNSDDDNNQSFNDIDFNIEFTTPVNFEELNEDWEIISISESKIELRHTSGGNGETDLLTFERI